MRPSKVRRWPARAPLTALVPALVLVAALLASSPPRVSGATPKVLATGETDPVHNVGDCADDSAIWIHPTDPALSLVIGADKCDAGGLNVYDLSGHELAFYADGRLNNVDLRYNFPLGATTVSIVGATNRTEHRIDFYRVNVPDRALVKIGSVATSSVIKTPRGFALYHSPKTGRYHAFVTDSAHTDQYELDGSTGKVTGRLVRQITHHNPTEGLVADDELARVYVAEEDIGGVFRYGAEPGDPTTGDWVLKTTENGGPITQDVKGLSLYYASGGRGYVLATSQGGSSFHLLDRQSNAWVGEFKVGSGNGIDSVSGIDGIDVTNFNLGSRYPTGLFVTQDHVNDGFNQNHKLVPWSAIAAAFTPSLIVDTSWDPRVIGGSGAPPTPTPTPSPTAGATSTPTPTVAPTPTPTVAPTPTPTVAPTPTPTVAPTATATPPSSGSIKRESTATVVNTTASSAVTIPAPAGIAAGDVLVACIALNGGTVSATGVPAGWNRIASVTAVTNPRVFGYYHVAAAGEPSSYRWSLSSTVANSGGIARYSHVSAASPLDADATTATGAASTTAQLPGVTTTSAGAVLVGCMSVNSSSATLVLTRPASMTEAWNLAGKRQETADERVAVPGATGPRTWTLSSAREWAGWLVPLRPG